MTTLHFAQISDIHFSSSGNHDELLGERAGEFLANALHHLNQIEDLEFVVITGDLFDQADQAEFDQFRQIIPILQKPYYVIPGNHDRRPPTSEVGLTRHDFARRFNPQFADRPTAPEAQVGYWSIEVHPKVRLIGLDSIKDEDWGGFIDTTQMAWLKDELSTHANKLIILAIHHPLHKLAPVDDHPRWRNFVCDCGPALLALLEQQPQVKLVLTGHHHLTKVDAFGRRLHVASPAISIYPCAYRTIRVTERAGGAWHIAWETHSAADPAAIAEARTVMIDTWCDKAGFKLDFVERHANLSLGSEYDRNGEFSA